MDGLVVRTEMQSNGEILLFYVDENGDNEQAILTSIDNIDTQADQDNSYVFEEEEEEEAQMLDQTELNESESKEKWDDEEIKRLLVFYNDNKQTFLTGTTKKNYLWTVACKTMLIGKNSNACEIKLNKLRMEYKRICIHMQSGVYIKWPYFELCHQAFQDDKSFEISEEKEIETTKNVPSPPTETKTSQDGIVVIKKVNKTASDEKVETMLKLYLKHKQNSKKEYWTRGLWETIALELGEDDVEYWHKRFLNFKQHYIRMLDKRNENGADTINWPYMDLFDQIFKDDEEFQRKFTTPRHENHENIENENDESWISAEMTILVKYYFDCYEEFQDLTIPKNYLWTEIGRLLDKTPEACKQKYEQLKYEHLNRYLEGEYTVKSRDPLAILFDCIISKEVESLLAENKARPNNLEIWKTEQIDELVQFFYDNTEIFKDLSCYYVCWAAISKKLKMNISSCRRQWEDLTTLYKTILNDKKENPDMQIDWRYIELFDRIFDYGMDTKLLVGYENMKEQYERKIGVKKLNITMKDNSTENVTDDDDDDEESFDQRGFTKRSKNSSGDAKAFKILEFYQKNKDKFSNSHRNKYALWEILAKQIGISATQCAHRYRNLKQVYTAYVQREINKPEMPIMWPYYALCKKVFGYRAIKSKLKNGKMDSDDSEDWSAKEIKLLINHFSDNFDEITKNSDDTSKWSALTSEIDKTENSCRDKFLELRKSYRKLKTMRARNPDIKINWKYFNIFEQIYNSKDKELNLEAMEVDGQDIEMVEDENNEAHEEDDYECIIVIPEGQDVSDISNAQMIMQEHSDESKLRELTETKPIVTKWNKHSKKKLLILYINYVRSHKGQEINAKDMWTDLASKLPDKTPLSCKKMIAKLKTNHRMYNAEDPNKDKSPYHTLLEKVFALKPKFIKTIQKETSQEGKVYKDVPLPSEKVEQALQYYLMHIEDFGNPKFEKKYLWSELANYVSEPITKVFNKINYLKQFYNSETDEVAGEKTEFGDLLKDILAKEIAIKLITDNEAMLPHEEYYEESWSDEETEQLLEWYLGNLEKFKNPKFVRKYLWLEVSNILRKSPLVCSKKMSEIRTQYRNMVKESPDELSNWRFYEMCQKIYGTGRRTGGN